MSRTPDSPPGSAHAAALAVALAALLALGGASRAEGRGNPALNAQSLRPSAFPGDVVSLRGADLPPHLTLSTALVLAYGHDPLVFVEDVTGAEHAVVGHQLTLDILASFSLFDRVGLGLALPLFLHQRGDERGFVPTESYRDFAVGDLRVSPVVVLLPHRGHGVGLALDLTFSVPTAQEGRFAGDAGLTFAPRLAVELAYAPLRVVFDLGYLLREDVRLGSLRAQDQLLFGVGAVVDTWKGKVEALLELRFATAAAEPFDEGNDQLEGLVGVRYRMPAGFSVEAALGTAFLSGWGNPDVRALASLEFAAVLGASDPDGDGLTGAADRCPAAAEDVDDFQDEDGCPDLDDDGDGVVDAVDRCRLEPEDADGFQDDDGCPDRDNDGDGVPDARDACPDDAEDRDGAADDDGCPEDDNDRDGLPDSVDRCPAEPETANGFEDADGCPDEAPVRVVGDTILLAGPVQFLRDGPVVDPTSFPTLELLARFLTAHPELARIRVKAHTDGLGPSDENLRRSRAQADAVVVVLVRFGVPRSRLVPVGRGESEPIAPNTDEESRAANRRVEFEIAR